MTFRQVYRNICTGLNFAKSEAIFLLCIGIYFHSSLFSIIILTYIIIIIYCNITYINTLLATKPLSKRTTLVGTIRGNGKEFPKSAKQKKYIMICFKSNNCTLIIYNLKRKKSIY